MSYSQSDLSLYDYLTNPITYNPAYTGITDSYFFKLSRMILKKKETKKMLAQKRKNSDLITPKIL